MQIVQTQFRRHRTPCLIKDYTVYSLEILGKIHLTLQLLETKIAEFVNSVDLDAVALNIKQLGHNIF